MATTTSTHLLSRSFYDSCAALLLALGPVPLVLATAGGGASVVALCHGASWWRSQLDGVGVVGSRAALVVSGGHGRSAVR